MSRIESRHGTPGRRALAISERAQTAPLRQRMLLALHRLADRFDAGPERISTAGDVALDGLDTVGENRAHASGYRPTPRWLIRRTFEALPGPVEEFVFVDFGSGRGRVVLEAARLPFRRVIGVEFAATLHEDATMTLRHWPRSLMACRDVDFLLDDAVTATLPESDLVAYLFDPFNERMFTRIAARLAYHARRWRVQTIIVSPSRAHAFRQSAAFAPVELDQPLRRRIALWSPYEVALFTAGPATQ